MKVTPKDICLAVFLSSSVAGYLAESVCLAVGAVVLADLVRTELEIPSKWGEAREALDAALLRAEALHVDFPTGPRAFGSISEFPSASSFYCAAMLFTSPKSL